MRAKFREEIEEVRGEKLGEDEAVTSGSVFICLMFCAWCPCTEPRFVQDRKTTAIERLIAIIHVWSSNSPIICLRHIH